MQGEAVRLKRLRQAGYFEKIFRFQRFNTQDAAEVEKKRQDKEKMGAKETFLLKPQSFEKVSIACNWVNLN